MRAPFFIAVAALTAGCFVPDLGDGAVFCGAGNRCPPKYFCHTDDNRCYRAPGSGGGGGDMMSAPFDFAGVDFAACVRVTCGPQSCGVIPDECGGTIDCGNLCSIGRSCGGGGTPHQCGCPTQVLCGTRNCGTIPDGCGGVTMCGGNCPSGQTCGGGNGANKVPNVCGAGGACMPRMCTSNKDCGLISDGCAAVLDCGACQQGKSCGTDHMCH